MKKFCYKEIGELLLNSKYHKIERKPKCPQCTLVPNSSTTYCSYIQIEAVNLFQNQPFLSIRTLITKHYRDLTSYVPTNLHGGTKVKGIFEGIEKGQAFDQGGHCTPSQKIVNFHSEQNLQLRPLYPD